MNDLDFITSVEHLVTRFGWRRPMSPSAMIEEWAEFVEHCESGYELSIFEFTNDRSIRDLLEKVLFHPPFWGLQQIESLRESVEAIDARFRVCSRKDVSFPGNDLRWWRRCVPLCAEGELQVDLVSARLVSNID
jgi:hypothetical protein